MDENHERIRIFLSFANKDRGLARDVRDRFKAIKPAWIVYWDEDIHPGDPFRDAVRRYIAWSHVFVPIITRNSQDRPWVHQETGYAIALDVPIVPLAIASRWWEKRHSLPGAMIEQIHAFKVERDQVKLDACIQHIQSKSQAPKAVVRLEVRYSPEDRTKQLVEDATAVLKLTSIDCSNGLNHVPVRQKSSLSSFSIPDCDPNDPVWERFRGSKTSKNNEQALREERQILEQHVNAKGGRLIIEPITTLNEPIMTLKERGAEAKATRLRTLLSFLKSDAAEQLQVIPSKEPVDRNWIIVGNWFSAESHSPGSSDHQQTLFNRHAPTVQDQLFKFDQKFLALCQDHNVQPEKSREYTIDEINLALEKLEAYCGQRNNIILNRNLYENKYYRNDKIFISAKPPIPLNPDQSTREIKIEIDLSDKAVVLDMWRLDYKSGQPTIAQLRSEASDRWLISGGVLLFDKHNRLAIGMRDGNAADPFAYTNIGAGRCDRLFKDHCWNELASECLLLVKREPSDSWEYIRFDSDQTNLELPNIPLELPNIPARAREIDSVGGMLSRQPITPRTIKVLPAEDLLQDRVSNVEVTWMDGENTVNEELRGFVWRDQKNHTIEFRLPLKIDLSSFNQHMIFFNEGKVGQASWKSLEEIAALADIQDQWHLVTPVLAELVKKR